MFGKNNDASWMKETEKEDEDKDEEEDSLLSSYEPFRTRCKDVINLSFTPFSLP